jgi:inner membrane protein
VRRPISHFRSPAPAAKYTYIDAFNGKSVTRETLLRYTFKSLPVNVLIRGFLCKTTPPGPILASNGRESFGMASLVSHAVAALSIGACFYRPGTQKRVWVIGAACSVTPDLDVIGLRLGIRYGDFWGHRGFTHSLFFAALLASAVVFLGFGEQRPGLGRIPLWAYFFLATASHGLLDAMTDGGLGVAFFAPFDNQRYFLPWTPIRVSPIGIGRFFTDRGLAVLPSEFLWIWLPAGILAISAWVIRRRNSSDEVS